jgi:hypothetical protein
MLNWGYMVAQSIEAVRYKPEGCGYQEYFLWGKGGKRIVMKTFNLHVFIV